MTAAAAAAGASPELAWCERWGGVARRRCALPAQLHTRPRSSGAPAAALSRHALPRRWHKLRWRQTSPAEGAAAERALLALSGTTLEARDVRIGPAKHDYMHTLVGGAENVAAPVLVTVPGYGAGAWGGEGGRGLVRLHRREGRAHN